MYPIITTPNDNIANNIIQTLYPDRTVVGIDMRNLYENGGMVHCVTQQQPATCINTTPEIVGSTNVCGLTTTTYSISPILPCATYQWIINNGTIISGGGPNDTTCTVQWNNSGLGNIQVQQTTP